MKSATTTHNRGSTAGRQMRKTHFLVSVITGAGASPARMQQNVISTSTAAPGFGA